VLGHDLGDLRRGHREVDGRVGRVGQEVVDEASERGAPRPVVRRGGIRASEGGGADGVDGGDVPGQLSVDQVLLLGRQARSNRGQEHAGAPLHHEPGTRDELAGVVPGQHRGDGQIGLVGDQAEGVDLRGDDVVLVALDAHVRRWGDLEDARRAAVEL
jgi:hypothetical protein